MDTTRTLIPSKWPAEPKPGLPPEQTRAVARYLFQTSGRLALAENAAGLLSRAGPLPAGLLKELAAQSAGNAFAAWLDAHEARLKTAAASAEWLRLPAETAAGPLDLETLADWLKLRLPGLHLLAEPGARLGRAPFYLDAWGFDAALRGPALMLGPGAAHLAPPAEALPDALRRLCAELYPAPLPELWRGAAAQS